MLRHWHCIVVLTSTQQNPDTVFVNVVKLFERFVDGIVTTSRIVVVFEHALEARAQWQLVVALVGRSTQFKDVLFFEVRPLELRAK